MTDDRTIDVNGQTYRIYEDDHGWVRIEPGRYIEVGGETVWDPVGSEHTMAFHPDGHVPGLIEALEEVAGV
jgi:hypothetical protein